jgi:hypothetical protein
MIPVRLQFGSLEPDGEIGSSQDLLAMLQTSGLILYIVLPRDTNSERDAYDVPQSDIQ